MVFKSREEQGDSESEGRRKPVSTGDRDLGNPFESEIHLAEKHLRNFIALEEEVKINLLKIETYIQTELMQLEVRTPPYSPTKYPEREKFQRRLSDLEKERIAFSLKAQEKRQALEEKILKLREKEDLFSE